MTDFQSEIFTTKDCELIKAVAEIFSLKNVISFFLDYHIYIYIYIYIYI